MDYNTLRNDARWAGRHAGNEEEWEIEAKCACVGKRISLRARKMDTALIFAESQGA